MGGEQAAFGRLLLGSRSLHSQVCRVCRFCAMSDFFFLFLRSHLLFVGRDRSGGERRTLRLAPDGPNKVLRNKLKKKKGFLWSDGFVLDATVTADFSNTEAFSTRGVRVPPFQRYNPRKFVRSPTVAEYLFFLHFASRMVCDASL